ncbi:MAG: amidohydrolase family protein [Bacteroidetes bacterium]|nr:amidohydrolase family protein [Bacteroidota bacterium]MCL5026257.1 amidohydrolase family protein [Chloroflexota bacterium]
MIIDFHYHFPHKPMTEGDLAERARTMASNYGAGGRNGLPLTAQEIMERLRVLNAPDPDGSRLLSRMDEANIDITVVVAMDRWAEFPDEAAVLAANKTCADWVGQHPDRLIAFAGVDPRRKDAPGLLRRCIEEYGMRGLKWHPDHGFYPNSPEAYAMLSAAQELKIPLLTHTGPLPPPRQSKFVHPNLLDDVCLDFPELKVVAAHMGRNWWADWAGLAQFRHNLFGDLAMWQFFAARDYARFCILLREVIDWCGIEAVIFGSDAPEFEALVLNTTFIKAIQELPFAAPPGVKFSEWEIDAILSGNAKRVLGL